MAHGQDVGPKAGDLSQTPGIQGIAYAEASNEISDPFPDEGPMLSG